MLEGEKEEYNMMVRFSVEEEGRGGVGVLLKWWRRSYDVWMSERKQEVGGRRREKEEKEEEEERQVEEE